MFMDRFSLSSEERETKGELCFPCNKIYTHPASFRPNVVSVQEGTPMEEDSRELNLRP